MRRLFETKGAISQSRPGWDKRPWPVANDKGPEAFRPDFHCSVPPLTATQVPGASLGLGRESQRARAPLPQERVPALHP